VGWAKAEGCRGCALKGDRQCLSHLAGTKEGRAAYL
jgi:hypothetical protein